MGLTFRIILASLISICRITENNHWIPDVVIGDGIFTFSIREKRDKATLGFLKEESQLFVGLLLFSFPVDPFVFGFMSKNFASE